MISTLPFASGLSELLGERLLVHPSECAQHAVRGVAPKLVAAPASVAEAALAMQAVAREEGTMIIMGAATKSHRGPPPANVDAVLSTRNLDWVGDYAPADLTISVGAGMRLAALDELLAGSRQFFPCDAPYAQHATVGGTLAANANGALRQRFGAIRDMVLGSRVALSDGTVAFVGAKVVKSVAGYDTHKLFIGSFGTLGLLGEVTLKIAPLPAVDEALAVLFNDCAAACAAALEIARAPIFPLAITLHDARSTQRGDALRSCAVQTGWLLMVRCAATRTAVGRQLAMSQHICRMHGGSAEKLGDQTLQAAWVDVRELAGGTLYPHDAFAKVKLTCLPSQTAAALGAISDVWEGAERTAHPSVGVVYASVPSREAAAKNVDRLWAACSRNQWAIEMSGAPLEAELTCPPLSPNLPLDLMRRLKTAFDPANALDRGRDVLGR